MDASSQSSRQQGVVAVIVAEGRWLVVQRSREVRAPGAWCFPGGGIEPGEAEPVTLRRELQEELAADVRPLQRLWDSVTAWDVALAWWQAELLSPPDGLRCNPQEVAQLRWLPPDEIADLPGLLSSNLAFLAAWRRGEFSIQ